MKKENAGIIFVISAAILWGLFPVFVNQGTKDIPPLFFAALASLSAAIISLFYVLFKKEFKEIKKKEAHLPLFLLTLFIVIIPYSLFFIGSTKTSGINISVLLLTEIIFTLIFTHFIGEKTTPSKLLGSGAVFIGALFVLYNGTLKFNSGDILIILSTLTYPLGNLYAKRALNLVPPSITVFFRSLIGGTFILLLALIFEKPNLTNLVNENWLIILFTGVILLGVKKLIWYEGLKRLDISKAISLIMTFPLFSLIILLTVFNEVISIYQALGIIIMMIGVYFSIKRHSTNPKLTKYASH